MEERYVFNVLGLADYYVACFFKECLVFLEVRHFYDLTIKAGRSSTPAIHPAGDAPDPPRSIFRGPGVDVRPREERMPTGDEGIPNYERHFLQWPCQHR